MKTLKIMSSVGIVLAAFSFLFLCMFNNTYDYVSAIGWGMYAALYLLAFAIVGLVQVKRLNK